jgi:hypothetical protein
MPVDPFDPPSMTGIAPFSFCFVAHASFSRTLVSVTLRKPKGIRQMAAMLKKALSVVAALLFTASVNAAGPELRTDHPDSYVVVKGDTLWDISGRFLKNPWYWPEIWQANPQIDNPHLIFPGDVISLVYIDGQPRLVVNGSPPGEPADVGPQMREEARDDAIPPLPLAKIRNFLTRPRVLSEEELEALPYVAANEESRIVGANGQLIYARRFGSPPVVGQKYVIARPTVIYSEMPVGWSWSDTKRDDKRRWSTDEQYQWTWSEWWFDARADVLAREVLEIGIATVTVVGDPVTLYVSYSDRELRRGDLLLPADEAPLPLNFYPRPPAGVPENMRVIGIGANWDHAGPSDVVVMNRGAQDGIEAGEVFALYIPGGTAIDRTAYPRGTWKSLFNPNDRDLTSPDEFAGHVMVFRTFDRISYGLVVNAVKPLSLGARLSEPTEHARDWR